MSIKLEAQILNETILSTAPNKNEKSLTYIHLSLASKSAPLTLLSTWKTNFRYPCGGKTELRDIWDHYCRIDGLASPPNLYTLRTRRKVCELSLVTCVSAKVFVCGSFSNQLKTIDELMCDSLSFCGQCGHRWRNNNNSKKYSSCMLRKSWLPALLTEQWTTTYWKFAIYLVVVVLCTYIYNLQPPCDCCKFGYALQCICHHCFRRIMLR